MGRTFHVSSVTYFPKIKGKAAYTQFKMHFGGSFHSLLHSALVYNPKQRTSSLSSSSLYTLQCPPGRGFSRWGPQQFPSQLPFQLGPQIVIIMQRRATTSAKSEGTKVLYETADRNKTKSRT